MKPVGKIFLVVSLAIFSLCIGPARAQVDIHTGINYYISFSHQKSDSNKYPDKLNTTKKVDPADKRIRGLLTLAVISSRQGELEESLVYAIQAKKLSANSEDKNLQITVSNFLTSFFLRVEMYEQAAKYISENEELNRYYGNNLAALQINRQKALLALKKHDYDAAERYSNAMRELMKPNTPKNFRTTFLFIRGDIYFQTGELELAKVYFENSLLELNEEEIFDPNISDLNGLIHQRLGQIALDEDDLDTAFEYLNYAERISKSSFNYPFLRDLHLSLQEYYKRSGDLEKAIYAKSDGLKLNTDQASLQKFLSNQLLRFGNEEKIDDAGLKQGSERIIPTSFAIIFLLILSKTTLNILRDEKEKRLIKRINSNKNKGNYPDFSEYLKYL